MHEIKLEAGVFVNGEKKSKAFTWPYLAVLLVKACNLIVSAVSVTCCFLLNTVHIIYCVCTRGKLQMAVKV